MSKYIIEIPDDAQYVLINGKADHKYYTAVHPIGTFIGICIAALMGANDYD